MIIALAGKKQCGKDTAAEYLCDNFGFTKDSFAEPIRRFVAQLCGLTLGELEVLKEVVHPLLGQTPRTMMQTLGTEWGRDMISQTIWTDSLLLRLKKHPNFDYVISDVRFDNEATAIRAMGGHIVHLHRGIEATFDTHKSEAGVEVVGDDFYIPNTGTVEDLHENLHDLIGELNV